jgi:LCCL domain
LTRDELKALLEQGFLASDAPARIQDLCQTPGTIYYFRVTGDDVGSVWGTDVYTGDSALSTAAVHAGAVKAGETTVVRLTVMPPLTQYQGSVRNGVTTRDYGRYGTAFRVDRV